MARPAPAPLNRKKGVWTFLSSHVLVLLWLSREPTARLRDLAQWIGITERAVQMIVTDLEAAGYLTRIREGRRNRYLIHADRPLRPESEGHHTVGVLLDALCQPRRPSSSDAHVKGRHRGQAP